MVEYQISIKIEAYDGDLLRNNGYIFSRYLKSSTDRNSRKGRWSPAVLMTVKITIVMFLLIDTTRTVIPINFS